MPHIASKRCHISDLGASDEPTRFGESLSVCLDPDVLNNFSKRHSCTDVKEIIKYLNRRHFRNFGYVNQCINR